MSDRGQTVYRGIPIDKLMKAVKIQRQLELTHLKIAKSRVMPQHTNDKVIQVRLHCTFSLGRDT